MSFEYDIDKKQNIVFVRFTSYLDDELLLAAFNRVYSDPAYVPVMNQCINYSDVSDLLLTRFGVEELATLCESFDCLNTNWKTIIIAPDDLVFGYGRMYQMLVDTSNEDVEVVRTVGAAIQLMGLSMGEYPFQQQKVEKTS